MRRITTRQKKPILFYAVNIVWFAFEKGVRKRK